MIGIGLELFFLGIIASCVLFMTGLSLATHRMTLRLLKRSEGLLPVCEKTLREAEGALHQSKQILTRFNTASEEVWEVVHKACRTISDGLRQLTFYKEQAFQFLGGRPASRNHNGNGARHHARRRYR